MNKNTQAEKADKPPYYAWQTDSSKVTTPQVQLWLRSGTMLGLRDLETARDLVKKGVFFVMCDQAIGQI